MTTLHTEYQISKTKARVTEQPSNSRMRVSVSAWENHHRCPVTSDLVLIFGMQE